MNKIGDRDYIEAAQELSCDVAAIRAVVSVESNGEGMLETGEPKILFEAHHFSRLTNGKYNITHPRISSPTWNRKLYIGGKGEHLRLQAAVFLDREAALQATSWGMFQLMGFNYKQCGFDTIQKFINAMYAGESAQLRAFVNFIKNDLRLLMAIQKKRWKTFARYYNGLGYKENNYDVKLEQAYKRYLH